MLENISNENIVNVYRFGSHVYGSQNKSSDEDYIVIVKEYETSPSIDVHYFTIIEFQRLLNNHDIQALECYFLPQKHILKETHQFSFSLNKVKLRTSISTVSDGAWVKGKKKLTVAADYHKKLAIKSIFHSIRIRDYGIQIASNGRIYDYSSKNYVYDDLNKIALSYERNECWDKIDKKYKPIYNSLRSQFVTLCPKEIDMKEQELQDIINSYKWIKVKRYQEVSSDAEVDFKEEYQKLVAHHQKETEFLIDKCRVLAQMVLDKK